MNKIFLIIQREYLVRVKKKSFLVMTFLTPLLFAGLIVGSTWLATTSKFKEDKVVEVFDESGFFKDKLESEKKIKFIYTQGTYEEVSEQFNKNENFALLHIPKITLDNPKGIKLLGKKNISVEFQIDIEKKLKLIIEDSKLINAGIDKDILEQTRTSVNIETKSLKDGKEEDSSAFAVYIIGFGAAFLIYMSVFLYGVQVMRGVIEEKTSRIVEVIISSVKPVQLLLGKIIGVALVGLTQFLLWIILTFALAQVGSGFIGVDKIAQQQIQEIEKKQNQKTDDLFVKEEPKTDNAAADKINSAFKALNTLNYPLIIGGFLFYFVFGYLLYSAMFAAVGSAGDSETDAQQFTFPVSMPLILAIIMAQFVINEPDGAIAFWGSMIPFTSPIIMMLRIPYDPPAWQIALSMVSLIGGFLFITWMASRIYRVGILMYGKKVTYKELGKWLFYKN